MFPLLKQRLNITVCIVVCGLLWMTIGRSLSAADSGSGLSLMSARIQPFTAFALALLVSVPVVALGSLVAAAGNPLSGVFAASAALLVLAAATGSIEDWIGRSQLPQAYGWLIVEMLMWFIPLVVLVVVAPKARVNGRAIMGPLACDEHYSTATSLGQVTLPSALGLLVSSVVAAVIGWFLLATSDISQVIVGLMIAFCVGGLAAHLLQPNQSPLPILLSPLLVGAAAYAFVLLKYDAADQLLISWRDSSLQTWQRFPALAKALPIHYASAAVAGSSLGVGWAQAILAENRQEVDEAQSDQQA